MARCDHYLKPLPLQMYVMRDGNTYNTAELGVSNIANLGVVANQLILLRGKDRKAAAFVACQGPNLGSRSPRRFQVDLL